MEGMNIGRLYIPTYTNIYQGTKFLVPSYLYLKLYYTYASVNRFLLATHQSPPPSGSFFLFFFLFSLASTSYSLAIF
ncbi:hypothetical protein F4809DRAFT_590926 [Biscogniauxia mediterranea]|nr:hypothetical protein F4809DRAFT_590926 [Biscogniauxia mediterranea]